MTGNETTPENYRVMTEEGRYLLGEAHVKVVEAYKRGETVVRHENAEATILGTEQSGAKTVIRISVKKAEA